MSTPPLNTPDPVTPATPAAATVDGGTPADAVPPEVALNRRKRRRRLLILLGVLVTLIGVVSCLLVRYLLRPEPLPDILTAGVNYPPHYLYTIEGVDEPMGVGLSPDGRKLYVTEVSGERHIKIFASDSGKLIRAFDPPASTPAERAPVYLTVDALGRVYVTDRLQHTIAIYNGDGDYLDTVLDSKTTLSGYVLRQAGRLPEASIYYYNINMSGVQYKLSGESEWATAPPPTQTTWSPLGISIAPDGRLLVTDVGGQESRVLVYPAVLTHIATRAVMPLEPTTFGTLGSGDGQLAFPNDVVVDSKGRFYVIDSNNGRITGWDINQQYSFSFGKGAGTGSLNLPHGAFLDGKDRLFVTDAVDHNVKVYNVAGDRPVFLYAFGEEGQQIGQFNYPNDIVLSSDGKLYVADRGNNRIQVWSY